MWPDEGSGIPKLLLHPSNPTYNGAVESTFTSLPFGDGLATSGTNADANHHARLDHDTETNSDHAQFRQYSSTQGRWMSADWTAGASAVPYATLTNPQSLNLYAYVGNDPNDGQDPNGHARYDGRLRSAVGDYNNYDESEMEQQADFLEYLEVQGETNSSPPTTDTSSAPASSNSQNHGTAATTAGSAQQQTNAGGQQGQQAPNANNTPAKFVIEPAKTENHGPYSVFTYLLENSAGQALTGNGYGVQEHLWSERSARHHAHIAHNSENRFVPLSGGEARDRVGYLQSAPRQRNYNVYQTFTVSYGGRDYNLHTEFEHETVIDDRRNYTNNVIDVVP